MRASARIGCWFAVACCLWYGVLVHPVAAQMEDERNTLGTSLSLTGLSGLVVTHSAHTLAPWTVIGSGAFLYMSNYSGRLTPTTDRFEGRGVLSLGLPKQVEVSISLSGIRHDNGVRVTGVGDLKLAGKWRFLDQREALWPSIAVATVLTLPTGQSSEGLRFVNDYGVELKLISSAEIDMSPEHYAIGLYVDGGFFFQDIGQSTEEKHGTYALGIILPLVMRATTPFDSPLQFLLEINGTVELGADGDFVTFSPSLRYVGPVTVTVAFQYSVHDTKTAGDGVGVVVLANVPLSFHRSR